MNCRTSLWIWILLLGASCALAPDPVDRGKGLIGFANLTRTGCDFCLDVEAGILRDFQAAGYSVFATDNAFDLNTGLANADAMVLKQVDLFIEFNGNLDAYPVIVRKMKSVSPPIPIVFVDGPPPHQEGVWYFGVDSPASGRMAGEWTVDWVKANWGGRIDGVISTWTSDWDRETMGRLEEFMAVLHAHDPAWSMDTVSRVDVKFEAEKAQAAFTAYLNAHPEARHVIMYAPTNDIHGVMAVAAAEAAGRERHVLVVARGCDQQARDEFRKGTDSPFRMSVGYFPERYGEHLVTLVTDVPEGREVASKTYMQHVVITPENLDQWYPE